MSLLTADDIVTLYQQKNYADLLQRVDLDALSELADPKLYVVFANAQLAEQINPYAILQTCDEALSHFPGFIAMQEIQFRCYCTLDKTPQAIESGLALFHQHSLSIDFLFQLAELLGKETHPQHGLVLAKANYRAADYYFRRGDFNQTHEYIDRALLAQTNHSESLVLRVSTLYSQGRFPEALKMIDQYQSSESIGYDLLKRKIDILNQTGNQALTLETILVLTQRFPEDAYAKRIHFIATEQSHSDKDNLLRLEQTFVNHPLDFWTTLKKSQLLQRLSFDPTFLNSGGTPAERWHQAETLYQSGLKELAVDRANSLFKETNDTDGLSHFLACLSVDRDHNTLRNIINSHSLTLSGQTEFIVLYARTMPYIEGYNKAFDFLTSHLTEDPSKTELLSCLAELKLNYFRQNLSEPRPWSDTQPLQQVFEHRIALDSKDSDAWYALGYIELTAGNNENAIDCIQKARDIGLVCDSAVFSGYWLAYAEYKLGLYEEALSSFTRYFEQRLRKGDNWPTYERLKTRIETELAGQQAKIEKITQPLKTPVWQRLVFVGVAGLVCLLLFSIDLSNSAINPFWLKMAGITGFFTLFGWFIAGFRTERRRQQYLNRRVTLGT